MRHTSYIKATFLAALVLFIGSADASRDGSGTYTLPAGNPVTSGTVISSSWANTTLQDIADAVSGSIAKDGQTVATANLPMGGFKHTNVADGAARNQYASVGQSQDFSIQTLSSVAGTNTITGALTPAITSYATGMLIGFTPANSNTGATTIAVNGLTARDIVKRNGDALAAGDLIAGSPALLIATSTNFVLVNPQGAITVSTTAAPQITIKGSSTSSANQGYVNFADSAGTSKGSVGDTSASDQDIYLSNATSSSNTNITANSGGVRLSFDNGSTFPTTFTSTATTINGVTSTPDTFSGTGTVVGCTTSPTVAVEARSFGRLVIVTVGGVSCTSNAVYFNITVAIPSNLQPPSGSSGWCGTFAAVDGTNVLGMARFTNSPQAEFILDKNPGVNPWTASGTKSILNGFSCTWIR